jgi:hypothetical protein
MVSLAFLSRMNKTNLARWVIEQLLQVLDSKVGDTDVLDLASRGKLLHLLPCLDEVPV